MEKELTAINSLLKEIEYLRNRSDLLDDILKYWDVGSMTFKIPDNWNLDRLSDEKKIEYKRRYGVTPRHGINQAIREKLPFSEHENAVNWDELYSA